jgi:hypothetical protein
VSSCAVTNRVTLTGGWTDRRRLVSVVPPEHGVDAQPTKKDVKIAPSLLGLEFLGVGKLECTLSYLAGQWLRIANGLLIVDDLESAPKVLNKFMGVIELKDAR